MNEKHKLTEKLKVLETDIYDRKVDLKATERKLNSAYSYEEELEERMLSAKGKTAELKKVFFVKASEISDKYKDMKSIFDVFTGNFYRD